KSDLANKRRGRIIRYAPLVLWIGMILFLSTSQASMSNTSRFIRPLLEFLFPNTPEETLIVYHGFIRKLAHLSEYAILAFFAVRAFSSSSVNFLQKYWLVASLALVFLVASIDEYNQSFNSLRTGSIYDVWLDVSGGLLMIIVLRVWRVLRAQRVKNNSS
ncbi:MAG: VanZ family protein, partial [Acidobacteriota bacterium]|nr:VanZ family protein [Acidobacteriota bacterium]